MFECGKDLNGGCLSAWQDWISRHIFTLPPSIQRPQDTALHRHRHIFTHPPSLQPPRDSKFKGGLVSSVPLFGLGWVSLSCWGRKSQHRHVQFSANFHFSFRWSQHRRPTHFSDVKITNKSMEIVTNMEFLVSRKFCTSDVGDWSISPAGTPGMKGTCEATKILFNFHFFFFPHFYFLLCAHLLCLFFSLSLLLLHSHQNYFHILCWYWNTFNVLMLSNMDFSHLSDPIQIKPFLATDLPTWALETW